MPRLIVTVIFWLQWTLITSLCLALLLPMWKSIGPWSLIAYWFLLGFSQSLVFLQRLPWAFASWFLTTSFVGVVLLMLLALSVGLFFIVMLSTSDIGLAPALGALGAAYLGLVFAFFTLPLLSALGGALLGWTQWRFLRHHVTRVGWWMPASIVSWIIGSIVLLIFLFSFKTQLFRLDTDSASSLTDSTFSKMLLSLAGVGAIGGAIKGGVLAWLLHQRRREF